MIRTAEQAALTNRALKAIPDVSSALPEEQRPLFRAFCAEVLGQLRTPYVARHGAENLPRKLIGLFKLFYERPGDTIRATVRHIGGRSVVVRTTVCDQPFVVNTVRLLVRTMGGQYEAGFNAIIEVTRDERGRVVTIGEGERESVIQVEAEGIGKDRTELAEAQLCANLRLARSMVRDFVEMSAEVERLAARFERLARRQPERAESFRETAEFLQWLLADNFVFMGLVEEDLRLGVERPELADVWSPGTHDRWADAAWGDMPLRVRKGDCESPVHRSGRVDEILVRVPDETGAHARDMILRGLFTYRAVTQPSRTVPVLRRVLTQILRVDDSLPGSWDYKGLANVFDSLPTEFLFTASAEEISRMVNRVRDAEREQEARVYVVQNLHGANVAFALAAMPKSQYSDALRQRMQRRLERALGSTYCDHGLFVGRFDTVLVHFYMTGAQVLPEEEIERLCEELIQLATPWESLVYSALYKAWGEAVADRLIARYGKAFDDQYTTHATAEQTLRDVENLEAVSAARPVVAGTFVDRKGRLSLRLYQRGDLTLTAMLPVLADFGLVIQNQYADTVRPADGSIAGIDTFRVKGVWGLENGQINAHHTALCEGIEAVFADKMESDQLNRLLLRARLSWREVDLLRTYKRHARQLGLHLSHERCREILLAHPSSAARLVRYFRTRFDPDFEGDREAAMAAVVEEIQDGLRRIDNHDDDLLIRSIYDLMVASLRTNFFQVHSDGAHYISVKIDHDLLEWVPRPKLKYEVYVHHAELEGVHLRGGKFARGGIRWSDRSDFRTEILGLADTQMVKNTLIVPEGSKGGFFMKRSIADWAERRRKADELYTFLMRGLLDITDNLVGGRVVRPDRVVAYDDDDPYLVVAADKGTAHLSNTANAIARHYGFWLDDAFASGGSHGYDHKAVGITARGAWVCVRRHFREMGIKPEESEFTCVGIGDPSGDVFGNGVIEYPTMRLLAAFNHRHIFLDPNPDPARSYVERKRLFDAALGWEHYDTSLISEGGGIFERHAKSIPLSPQVKKMLGVLQDEASADSVIRKLLRMPVDLLWNGGIGTYVKASHETHRQVDDVTNDGCRVNADELRCKAVGEGGNLGFTQAARIEYALRGGRLNTDAVDNSGGVDMSDHEVNLKILLAAPLRDGRLSVEERNAFIEELTDEIAEQVLANNDNNARQISLDRARSVVDPMPFGRAIDWVCRESGLSREALRLPSDAVIAKRAEAGQGLTRPELSVVAAHVKMRVYKALLGSDTSIIPDFDQRVLRYFPARVHERYAADISEHMLHQAIGLTASLNEVVADNGATFFPTLIELTSAHPTRILAATLQVSEALGLPEIRTRLGASGAPLEACYEAWRHVSNGLLGLLSSWLAPGAEPPGADCLAKIGEVLRSMARSRHKTTNGAEEARQALIKRRVPKALASRCVAMGNLSLAREIATCQKIHGDKTRDAVVRYLAIGKASRVLGAIHALEAHRASGRWDPLATGILRNRYFKLLATLVEKVEVGHELRLSVDRAAHQLYWNKLKTQADALDAILGDAPDLGAFLVAEERIRAFLLR